MIDRAREIVGSSEIRPLAVLATYEDFDSPTAPLRYTETLYKAECAGYCLMIGRDLFEVSQGAAFSWLNRRGFFEVVIGLYCDLEGSEIERPTEESDVRVYIAPSRRIGNRKANRAGLTSGSERMDRWPSG